MLVLGLLPAAAHGAPANDRFADQILLTGDTAIGESTTVGATFEPGEIDDYWGGSVWWSWTAPADGTVQIDTCGSQSSTPLTIWRGSSVTNLTWVAESDYSSFSTCVSPVVFEAQGGVTYRIAAYGGEVPGPVTVRVNYPPVNDDFANAFSLGSLDASRWLAGTTRLATREAGEPDHAEVATGGSVWYRWTAVQTGLVSVDTCDSWWYYDADTVVGVYTGSETSALTEVASNDDGADCFGGAGSSVTFLATAGVDYYVAVAGKSGERIDFELSISPPPANDLFAQASELEDWDAGGYAWGDTRRATSEPDEPAHGGAPASSSLWYHWTAESDGPVEIVVCGWGLDPRLAVYRGTGLSGLTPVATGESATCGDEGEQGVEATFDAAAGHTYRIAVDSVDGVDGSFDLSLYTRSANDDFDQARDVDRWAYVSGSTRMATAEMDEPDHAGVDGGHSVWFRWTADTTGAITPSVCAWFGGASVALAVYTGETVSSLTEVATGSQQGSSECSDATFMAQAGTTYLIAVDDRDGSTDFDLWFRSGPANDSIASAQPVLSYAYGSNWSATKEPGEPDHAGEPGGRSVWFRWSSNVTGTLLVSTCETSFDTVLAVYTGSPDAGYHALTERVSADDGCEVGGGGSMVALDVVAGTEYLIAVDGKGGASGSFELEVSGAANTPVNDDFGSSAVLEGASAAVTGSTATATREVGEPNHAGGFGYRSVWYRWKAPSNGPGQVTFDTCGSLFDTVLAVYTGASVTSLSPVASNNDGCGIASTVSFTYEPGTVYRIAIDGWGGAGGEYGGMTSGDYELKVAATVSLPENDDFAQARPIEQANAFLAGNTTGATKEAGEPSHAGDPGGASVWYRWTPTEDGSATLDTCGSEIDTLLALYTGDSVDDLAQVAADDDSASCADAGASALTIAVTAGTDYWIAVDGKGGEKGEIVLSLNRPVNDDFADATAIAAPYAQVTGSTLGATVEVGEPQIYPPPTNSVWYRWTAPESKRVALHTCAAPGSSMGLRVYTGSSLPALSAVYGHSLTRNYSDDCSGAYFGGATASMSFNAVAGTTYSIAVDAPPAWSLGTGWGGAGPFTLAINTPLNDLRPGPHQILGPNGQASGSNVGATKEAGEWRHAGNDGGSSVWYRWFATATGSVTVDTCASAIDTVLSVQHDAATPPPAPPAGGGDGDPSATTPAPPPVPAGPLAENDDSDACSDPTRSSVTFHAFEGVQYAIAVDGKDDAIGQVEIKVDLEAPDVTPPDTAQPFSPYVTGSPSAYFNLERDEPGSTFECSVDEEAFEVCGQGGDQFYSYLQLTGLSEGEHSLDVRERDLAGNVDPTPVRVEIRVDMTAPDTSIESGPGSHTRNQTVGFGFSSTEPGGWFYCSLDGGASEYCGSANYSYYSLAEGSYTFSVWAVDQAGNADLSPATYEFTVDRSAPSLEISSGPTGPTRLQDVSFGFQVDDPGATTRCRLQPAGMASVPFAECSSPFEQTGLADRAYSFFVEATDAAGNQDVKSRVFTVDTTPPRSSLNQAPSAYTNDPSASFVFSANEPTGGFRCSLDGAPLAACASPVVTDALPDGEHVFEVEATDVAGNVEDPPLRREFTVDTAPPETDIVSGPESRTRHLGPFAFASTEPLGRFECSVDGGPFANCSSSYNLPSLPDGERTLSVRAVDRAGNVDLSPAARTITLDRTAPTTTIDTGPEGQVDTANVAFEFSADEPASFRCRLDGVFTVDCDSPWEYTDLKDANHSFSVYATDLAGNVESEPVVRQFRVEARPPETTLLSTPPSYTSQTEATFAFDGDEADVTFECSLDDEPFASCDTPTTLAELADGEHRFRVRAVDLADKRDPTPAEHAWTVDTHPPGTTIESGPDGPVKQAGPFHFTADEPVKRFECAIDSGEFAPCAGGHTANGLSDGEHTFKVRAVDRADHHDPEPAERSFVLDTVAPLVSIVPPPGGATGRSVEFDFEASEDGATFECRLDGGSFGACGPPVSFSGLADGPHVVSIRATDAAGNTGPVAHVEFVVDVDPPETTITQSPPSATNETTVEFRFTGTDAESFRCALDDGDFEDCSSPKTYAGLDDGEHRFRVHAVDAVGNQDPTPAERTFVVDTEPPDTTITSGPQGPVHAAVGFSYASSESAGTYECSVNDSPFKPCGVSQLKNLGAGDHVFRVRALDPAGNHDPSPAERHFTIVNEKPVAELELSTTGGPARLDVVASFGATDADEEDDELHYRLDFGDGRVESGRIPDGPTTHRYDDPGVYLVGLEVTDGIETTVVTKVVTVTLPEPLEPKAGDDQIVVAGEPVVLDGADSRPLRGIDGYIWSPGDGSPAKGGEVVQHTYEDPGTYEAKLTVTGPGETKTDTAQIKVLSRPGGDGVKVTVKSGGSNLEGADVMVILPGGEKVRAVTAGNGVAKLYGLPDGEYKVYAYKPGYIAGTGDATASGGEGTGEIDLTQGDMVEAEVDSKRLTYDEIIAEGIDPNDPDNQHVYQFEVHLNFSNPGGGGGGGGGGWGGYFNRGGWIGGGGSPCVKIDAYSCYYESGGVGVLNRLHWVEDVPMMSQMVIPFKASWLKEFFAVTLTVHNLGGPDFTLKSGNATVTVPSGMSLAPTGQPQSYTTSVPDIPGGESRTARWVLRGDEEGEYPISVTYAGMLDPFDRIVKVEATSDPIKVWGASALQLIVDVDEEAQDRFPYTVFVKLENVSDVPVHNPAVELLEEGRVGYIEQPRQQRIFQVRELAPGDTHNAGPFILVPEVTGTVDLARSFIKKTAGDVDLGGTIVTHEREPAFSDTPEISSHARKNAVVFDIEPVEGAEGYEVYATPDRETDFPDTPLSVTSPKPNKLKVPVTPGEKPWFGVSTLLEDGRKMFHPLTTDESSATEIWPAIDGSIGKCGVNDQNLTVEMDDPDFDLTRWRYKIGSQPWQDGGELSGSAATKTIAVEIGNDPTLVQVQAQNTEQAQSNPPIDADEEAWGGPVIEKMLGLCNYVAIGDSVSAGEGIGYGYTWDKSSKRWKDDEGAATDWSTAMAPFGITDKCHQTTTAHPRKLASELGLRLTHLSCTGASFDEGIAGVQPKKDLSLSQIGGFDGANDANEHYSAANPDWVTLSLGMNDINFADAVAACFYPGTQLPDWIDPPDWLPVKGTCNYTMSWAEDRLESGEVAEGFSKTYARIREMGEHKNRTPVILHTQYYDPFPQGSQDRSCFDMQGGGLATGYSQADVDRMRRGLQAINDAIKAEAAKQPGVIAVPPPAGFRDHPFCSEDPWVFGMDTGVDYQLDNIDRWPHQEAPFHPTEAGQQAIADQLRGYIDSGEPTLAGDNVDVRFISGERLRFYEVVQPGASLVIRKEEQYVPPLQGYSIRQAYEIESVATFTGPIQVVLPAQQGDRMLHYTGGRWEDVQATYDGSKLQGSVTSLSPFVIAREVPAVTARITGGEGGVAPHDVSLSASTSEGPVDSVEWDFGDGVTGAGANVTHEYELSGSYDVELTVKSTDGAVDRSTKTVVITNPGPTVDATLPPTATVGEEIVLDSRASTDPNGVIRDGWWEVDGKFVEPLDQRSTVTFDEVGTVEVVGVVRDDELKEDRKTFDITVAPEPDTTPPDTTIIVEPAALTTDSTALFEFESSEDESTFECHLNADAVTDCTSPHAMASLPDGDYDFAVSAVDKAGNKDPSPATATFRVDTIPPTTTITAGPAGVTGSRRPAFSFMSSEPNSTFACRLDSDPFAACSSPWTAPLLTEGPHTFGVRATDQAGNAESVPATRSFTVQVPSSSQPPGDGVAAQPQAPKPQPTGPKSKPKVTAACRRARSAHTKAQRKVRSSQRMLRSAKRPVAKRKWRRAVKKRRVSLRKATRQVERACA
jgi:PKD repeat protein